MPYSYQSKTSDVESKAFLVLTDNGSLVLTDFYPENNWKSVNFSTI
jgi:hypothetical protein